MHNFYNFIIFIKDDYINASSIKSLTPGCGDLIVTQLPVRGHLCELLKLVWQEGIETMVSLVPQQDMADSAYLPVAKQCLAVEEFTITCQSLKVNFFSNRTDRIEKNGRFFSFISSKIVY